MLQRSSICRRNRVSYRRFPFPIILSAVLLILLGAFQGIPEGEAQDAPRMSEVVMNGWRWFHVYCFRCHGMDAVGSQIAPNLRESIKVLPHDEFLRIIREGRPEKRHAGVERVAGRIANGRHLQICDGTQHRALETRQAR